MARRGASRRFLDLFRRTPVKAEESGGEKRVERVGITQPVSFAQVAGLKDIFEDTSPLRDHNKSFTRNLYDDEFDLYDEMLKLDPELNGAVRSVSLTANNWEIDYTKGKNRKIRNAIEKFVYNIDFDDILITILRNLMVYGNDINKVVGKTGVGITKVQSLPVHQMTIKDGRVLSPHQSPANPQLWTPKSTSCRSREHTHRSSQQARFGTPRLITEAIGFKTGSDAGPTAFGVRRGFQASSSPSEPNTT